MFISKKMTKYFEENKDKSKEEVIKGLVDMGYKECTAKIYYSHRKVNVINRHKIAFDFFKANPGALIEMDNKTHSKELGISINTYATYKSEYKAVIQKENLKLIQAKREKEKVSVYGSKYYKDRLRQKFEIDDSRLFGYV